MNLIEDGQNRLILYPLDASALKIDKTSLNKLLERCEFVSRTTSGDELRPGPLFMNLLTFIGCSPSVADADDPGPYNQYSVSVESFSGSVLIASRKTRSPECAVCHEKDRESKAIDCVIQETDAFYWVCPGCNEKILLDDINWRHKLALASTWVQINGVFEGEVLPGEKFLDLLKRETGTKWSYCYC